ncbi:MAG: pyridoxal-phosphate dependent enzyme [Longimicrobiales bacterium]|nr:pyridoxal-phosphate dependent enzyme [Longimicrobiales bacterium]
MNPSDPNTPTHQDLRSAAETIGPHAHRTPVLTSRTIDRRVGGRVFFKCENFQRAGAFKFRGACNAVFSLSEEALASGVATHSSGNHGQALALAASLRGVPAYVVMPENSPAVKVEAVKGYGGNVTFCEPTLKGRETTLGEVIDETGAREIHPFDEPLVIAGQGTAAMELLHEQPELDLILAPVGGGGLLSGTALAVEGEHGEEPGESTRAGSGTAATEIRVIGAEPALADDALRSLRAGSLQTIDTTRTIADGLRTTLSPRTFTLISRHVDDIVTVEEHSIIEAMRFVWERMKIVIEASAAVPVAALLEGRIETEGRRIGVILSGGNVDLTRLPWQD